MNFIKKYALSCFSIFFIRRIYKKITPHYDVKDRIKIIIL